MLDLFFALELVLNEVSHVRGSLYLCCFFELYLLKSFAVCDQLEFDDFNSRIPAANEHSARFRSFSTLHLKDAFGAQSFQSGYFLEGPSTDHIDRVTR